MTRMFDCTKKKNMEELDSDSRKLMARIVVRDVKQIAKRLGVSEEIAYEAYRRGLLGGDRQLG